MAKTVLRIQLSSADYLYSELTYSVRRCVMDKNSSQHGGSKSPRADRKPYSKGPKSGQGSRPSRGSKPHGERGGRKDFKSGRPSSPHKTDYKKRTRSDNDTPRRENGWGLGPGAQSRLIIARAIQTVWGQGVSIEEALEKQNGYHDLSSRDRAFIRNVTAVTFRRWGQITYILKQYLKKQPPAFIMAVLRSAVAQSLFLKTPDHAVVGESVAAMKAIDSARGFVGMANAVLRRITETGSTHIGAIPPHNNVPGWILKQWERDYGRMEARRIARQVTEIPPLDISIKTKADKSALAQTLEAAPMTGQTLRRSHAGNITALDGFDDGTWWIQDMASALPVQLLHAHLGGFEGQHIFDLCAAPGGKTLQLADLGAKVTAIDKSEFRLKRLEENLKRCKLTADVLAADVLNLPDSLGQADHILLDAPCTATGTFRRHPEVLYNRKPKDQAALIKLQKRLLKAASMALKPGGTLTFCTCSLQKAEGEEQIMAFLNDRSDFRLNRILTKSVLDLDSNMIVDGVLRTQPNFRSDLGGMDGFFTAILQKTG